VAALLAALIANALLVHPEVLRDFLGLLADRLGFAGAQRGDFGMKSMMTAVGRVDVEQSLARALEMLDLGHVGNVRIRERNGCAARRVLVAAQINLRPERRPGGRSLCQHYTDSIASEAPAALRAAIKPPRRAPC